MCVRGFDPFLCACFARSERLTRALTQLAGEGRSKEAFLAAVREVTAGLTKLAGREAPPAVYATLQHVRRVA